MQTRIVEIKEFVKDSELYFCMYEVKKLIDEIETNLHFTLEINKDDYTYMNLVMNKIKVNLKKVSAIMNFNKT